MMQLQLLSEFFCDVAVIHSRFLTYTPSHVAAAAVTLGRMGVEMEPWNGTLAHYTGMSFGLMVKDLSLAIYNLHLEVFNNKE